MAYTRLYENPAFLDWLAVYFVNRGNYTLTPRALQELSEPLVRQRMSFSDHFCTRDREEAVEVRSELSPRELEDIVGRVVAQKINDGEALRLLQNEHIVYRCSWTEPKVRKEVESAFFDITRYEPTEVTRKHLTENGMRGLVKHHNGSTYSLLVEAGKVYTIEEAIAHADEKEFKSHKLYPWQMKRAPEEYNNEQLRAAAFKWMYRERRTPTTQEMNQYARGAVARAGSISNARREAGQSAKNYCSRKGATLPQPF